MKTHTFSVALIMFSRKAFAFVASPAGRRAFHSALAVAAKPGQAEVILVGCGAPNRGMGWYHGIQVCDTWGGMNNCNKGGGRRQGSWTGLIMTIVRYMYDWGYETLQL